MFFLFLFLFSHPFQFSFHKTQKPQNTKKVGKDQETNKTKQEIISQEIMNLIYLISSYVRIYEPICLVSVSKEQSSSLSNEQKNGARIEEKFDDENEEMRERFKELILKYFEKTNPLLNHGQDDDHDDFVLFCLLRKSEF